MTNSLVGNNLYLGRFFQIAYVTRDLNTAVSTFQNRYGIRSFQYLRDNRFDEDTFIDIALAWAGDVMIELIEPRGAGRSMYDVMLGPDAGSIRHHHLGHVMYERDEWDRLQVALRDSGQPIAAQGKMGDVLEYVYTDARKETGHFLEYIYCSPTGRAFFDNVPRN